MDFPLRFCRRICLEATTMEIETLPLGWRVHRVGKLLLMRSEFYCVTVPRQCHFRDVG